MEDLTWKRREQSRSWRICIWGRYNDDDACCYWCPRPLPFEREEITMWKTSFTLIPTILVFYQTWLMLSRWRIMMKRTHDNTRKESKSRWKENHEKWRTRKDKRQHPSSLITSWPPHGNLQDWKKHQQLKTHTTEESKMDSKGTLLLLFLHGARWRLDLKLTAPQNTNSGPMQCLQE